MEKSKKEIFESIRDKVLAEWDKGNLVYADIEGLKSVKFEEFIKQPLDGMLYDINRNTATILTFIEDPKWVNDFALTKLLEYYYNKCNILKEENKLLEDELVKSIPIPQYNTGDVCVDKDGGEVTIVGIVADQYKYDANDYPYEKYEFFRAFENMYKVKK